MPDRKRHGAVSPMPVRSRRGVMFDDISNLLYKLEGLIEIAVITLIYYLIWRTNYRTDDSPFYGKGKFVLAGVYIVLTFIIFFLCDGFKFGQLRMSDIVISQCISMLIVNFITYFQLCLIVNHMVTPLYMLLLTIADFCVSVLMVGLFNKIYRTFSKPQNMILVYGQDNAVDIKFKMDTRLDKYNIDAIINVNKGLDAVCAAIDRYDAVIINDVPAQIRNDLIKYCYAKGICTYIVPKISDITVRGAEAISLFDTPLLQINGTGLTPLQSLAKRTLDLVLCIIALIPFAPIMLITAACIKAEDRGPVFYRQTRVTKDGKEFDIIKFRSMVVNAEKQGKAVPATDNDARITRTGRFIRKTRIDEIPQIFNIIKGDMSIVGPRPERVEHVLKYSSEIPEFAYRFKVKGGLTGYAQIYGKYNTSPYDKLRLDLMYIENYSILMDIKLIFTTLRILFKPESTEGFNKAAELKELGEKIISESEKKIEINGKIENRENDKAAIV